MSTLPVLCRQVLAVCSASALIWAGPAAAVEPVWHCSKHHSISLAPDPIESLSAIKEEDLFYLSSFHSTVISISLNDLAELFNGQSVAIGQMPITACVVAGDSTLNRVAFQSIGLRWSSLQAMTSRNGNPPNLSIVQHEDDMRTCIVNNFPAVGYMRRVVEDEDVAPCF